MSSVTSPLVHIFFSRAVDGGRRNYQKVEQVIASRASPRAQHREFEFHINFDGAHSMCTNLLTFPSRLSNFLFATSVPTKVCGVAAG